MWEWLKKWGGKAVGFVAVILALLGAILGIKWALKRQERKAKAARDTLETAKELEEVEEKHRDRVERAEAHGSDLSGLARRIHADAVRDSERD